MNNTYITDYNVKYSEVDADYSMRLDSIISHFQDITGIHSSEMGVDAYSMKSKSNAFWVITKIKLKLLQLPKYNDYIKLETWPTTVERIRLGRDYAIHKNGERIVLCSSEWCTMDCDTHMPRRTSTICYPHNMPHRQDRGTDGIFIKLKEEVSDCDLNHKHIAYFTDIDTNRHTNNIAYLRMMLNCFTPDEFSALTISELQFYFLSQTYLGDEILVYKKKTDNGFYIEGRLDNKPVFNCLITLKS